MAENDVSAGVDQLMALALEVLRGLPDELISGVERQNDLVGMRPCLAQLCDDRVESVGDVIELACIDRIRHERPTQERVAATVLLVHMNRLALRAAMRQSSLVQGGDGVVDAARAVIENVIVGEGQKVNAAGI